MIQLIVLAHAPLASSLASVAAHAFPDCASTLRCVDVLPSDGPEEIERRLRDAVGQAQALVLCDVFGATPCNAALRVADGVRVRVVAGVNVPMLWRVRFLSTETPGPLVEPGWVGPVNGGLSGTNNRAQTHRLPGCAKILLLTTH